MKILLVDDEEEIVEEMSRFLIRRGHAVVSAGCVATALSALDIKGPFDAVLTDLRMPGGSGLDVLRACQRLPQPRPAALVMSGHAGPQDIAAAHKEGARQVFTKPVVLRQLLQTLAGIEADHAGGGDADRATLAGAPPATVRALPC